VNQPNPSDCLRMFCPTSSQTYVSQTRTHTHTHTYTQETTTTIIVVGGEVKLYEQCGSKRKCAMNAKTTNSRQKRRRSEEEICFPVHYRKNTIQHPRYFLESNFRPWNPNSNKINLTNKLHAVRYILETLSLGQACARRRVRRIRPRRRRI
jgi:hypothetical protein